MPETLLSISEFSMFRRIAFGLIAALTAGSAMAADYPYGGGYGSGAGYRSPQYRGEGYYGGYGYRRPDGFAGRPGGYGYNAYGTYPYRPDAVYNRPAPREYVGDRPVFTPESVDEAPPALVYQRRSVTKTVTTTVTTETVVAPQAGVGYVPW